MTIYERYCKLRDERGMKDADVAKATGIGKSTFSDFKSGRSVPKMDKLQKIADLFDVSVAVFLKDDIEAQVHKNIQSYLYYRNSDTAAVAQDIFEDSDLRALFDAAKDSRPQDLQMAAELLRRLKETNRDG